VSSTASVSGRRATAPGQVKKQAPPAAPVAHDNGNGQGQKGPKK